MMQNNEAMHPASLFTNGARASEQGKELVRGSERDATCWTMWFSVVSEQHSQTGTDKVCSTIRVKRLSEVCPLVPRCLDSIADSYSVVYFHNTSLVYSEEGKDVGSCFDARSQASTFMLAGVYEQVCEGDQQVSVSCWVFARTGLEKKKKEREKATKANRPSKRAGLFVNVEPKVQHHLDTPDPPKRETQRPLKMAPLRSWEGKNRRKRRKLQMHRKEMWAGGGQRLRVLTCGNSNKL